MTSPNSRRLNIGLIGAGFIGRCHVFGYTAQPVVFPGAAAFPTLELLAEATPELAASAAKRLGFRRHTADWRALVADPAIDIVDICVPSNLHREIALAAIAAGKTVYCEKPVGLCGREATEIAAAAARAGVRSLTGFTYLRNPLVGLAQRLIAEGAIGRVLHFRGAHNEDYLSDPAHPFIWRCDPAVAGKAGALGDLGCHIISIAEALCGEIRAVSAMTRTVIAQRPVRAGATEMRAVGNDDQVQFLAEFADGATGHLEASRVATGSKMDITFEVTGTEGALQFDGERLGEIRLYSRKDGGDRQGFRTIYAGPAHPPYGNFLPGAAHGISFNDLKVIEVQALMQLVAAGEPAAPDLAGAAHIGRLLNTILVSAKERCWVEVCG
jgi:predicted dehydrogenase